MMEIESIGDSSSQYKCGKKFIQIKVIGDSVKILLSDWKVFPCLYGRFLVDAKKTTGEDTLCIEKEGKLWREEGGSDSDFSSFFDRVLKWGGKTHSFIEMHTKRYGTSKEDIVKDIRCAMRFLQKEKIEDKKEIKKEYIKNAIEKITKPKPKGLGISYGSKILRMLAPQQVGVYDSVLAKYLYYKNNDKDYAEFCIDCRDVVDKLNDEPDAKKEKEHCGKTKGDDKWRVADVEAVLFFACSKKQKIEIITYEL